MSYTALRVVAFVHKLFAVLIWVFEAVGIFGMTRMSSGLGATSNIANLAVIAFAGGLAFVGVLSYAAGEIIELAINVAQDVRTIAENSAKPLAVDPIPEFRPLT